jgi:hypothetical protein
MASATLKRKPLRAAKVAAQNAHAAPLALSRASFARELAKAFLSPRRSLGPAIIAGIMACESAVPFRAIPCHFATSIGFPRGAIRARRIRHREWLLRLFDVLQGGTSQSRPIARRRRDTLQLQRLSPGSTKAPVPPSSWCHRHVFDVGTPDEE